MLFDIHRHLCDIKRRKRLLDHGMQATGEQLLISRLYLYLRLSGSRYAGNAITLV